MSRLIMFCLQQMIFGMANPKAKQQPPEQLTTSLKREEMKKTILLSAAFGLLAAGVAQAGVISGWDKSLVVTDPEPVGGYIDFTT